MPMNEHSGHRRRMRERFLSHGLDNFDDHNVLELLLFYALPRQDTNRLAHRLMEHHFKFFENADPASRGLHRLPRSR